MAKSKRKPIKKVEVRVPVFTIDEFKERIKQIVGLKPAPYYNPPVKPNPLIRKKKKQRR